ncbi:hypothetical protein [Acinetobacter ursingii]|uniref:hypothetical protein n=1 Tax=Acinetobacter ursingii TaxID=108980 RepID=UPI0021CD2714|nr:hypothetical protein [Acinetobacter ursingii]MCU4521929.1 hypothetical protein [Acinetobacter ursingii]
MDFKNKQGTVDSHNVNLNFKPDNTDSHNLILNFEHLSDGSTNLNFGDDVTGEVKSWVNIAFNADIKTIYTDSTTNIGVIECSIQQGFRSEIVSVFSNNAVIAAIQSGFNAEILVLYIEHAQVSTKTQQGFISDIQAEFVENLCTIETQVNLGVMSQSQALFDLNFILGMFTRINAKYEVGTKALLNIAAQCSQAISLSNQFFIAQDQGLTIANGANARFEKAKPIVRAVKTVFEETTHLQQSAYIKWQQNEKVFISDNLLFDDGLNLPHLRTSTWQEMIRKRKQITYSHEVAHVFEKKFILPWAEGLELRIKSDLPWEEGRAIYYRKHPVEPWPEPEIPEYVGSTDLNFFCLCSDVDSHHVILNFGVDDCIPSIPNQNWWHIVNEIEVTRLDSGQIINVLNGNYRTDRQSWCWSYSLTIPVFELSKLDPIDNKPVILKIVVNGFEHLMLLENRTRSRQFAKETYTLTGRSPSALLDSPSSPPRAFLQENERTSVQLAQAEIDRSAYPDLSLNWELIDALGWIVPTESFSYSGLTPIKAIQEVATAGGGFVYSESDSQTITIKPLYKKTFWNLISVDEYDILLPESIVLEQSTDYESYPDYNGVSLTNDKTGQTGIVKRTGTSGDVLVETVNNNLFTSASVMGSFGKAALARAGLVEKHTFNMPLTTKVGQCKPADVLAFNAEWWGIVDAVSVSFTYSKVSQSVTVERVQHE